MKIVLTAGAMLLVGCGTVSDARECTAGEDTCGANASCVADVCECDSGYEWDSDSCVAAASNECANDTHMCVDSASGGACTDTPDGYTCSCADGYDGDGRTDGTGCTDVDECAASNDCTSLATCTNTTGSYSCTCPEGYDGDGLATGTGCDDVDECQTDPCDANATCSNSDGSFNCTCNAQYAGDGFTCTPCQSMTIALTGAQNLAMNYSEGTVYRDNNVRAYSNPDGTCGAANPPCDITGWVGFDLAGISDNVSIKGMRLYLWSTNVQQAQPKLRVQYSNADNWDSTTAVQSTIPRTTADVSSAIVLMAESDVGNFKEFPIDVTNNDFSPDLLDDWLTLGVDNTELAYSYAYFEGVSGDNLAHLEIDVCQ